MVAACAPRAARVLPLVVLLLAAGVPAPTAEATFHEQIDVYLDVRSLQLLASNGRPIQFLNPGETAELRLVVHNAGLSTATNIPLYVWLDNSQYHCKREGITIPAARPGGEPGIEWYNVSFTANDQTMPNQGYNITVLLNQDLPAEHPPFPADCRQPKKAELGTDLGEGGTQDRGPEEGKIYFVKGHRLDFVVRELDWCRTGGVGCQPMLDGSGTYHNSTRYPENAGSAYFRLGVENIGTWTNLTNFSSRWCETSTSCPMFNVTVEVRVKGHGITGTQVLRGNVTNYSTDGHFYWKSDPWSLQGKAGDYEVTAAVNPFNTLREIQTTNNEMSGGFQVRSAELRAVINASEFRTSAANPYPYVSGTRINGTAFFYNDGLANASRDNRRVDYRIYLNNLTSLNQVFRQENDIWTSVEAQNYRLVEFGWSFSTDPRTANYLAPGRHLLVAEVDHGGNFTELNETDNRTTIEIYIEDNAPPIFDSAYPRPKIMTHTVGGPDLQVIHPNQTFDIEARLNDSDYQNLHVEARWTLVGNTSIQKNITLSLVPGHTYRFFKRVFGEIPFYGQRDGVFDPNATFDEWSVLVNATDSQGNSVQSAARSVRVERWPLHAATEGYIVLAPADNAQIDYENGPDPEHVIRLRPNMTGFENQVTSAANVELWVDPPGDTPPQNMSTLTPILECADDLCVEQVNKGNFSVKWSRKSWEAGKYNWSLEVWDVSGAARTINRTLTLVDALPQFPTFNLNASVNAGENVTLEAVVTDDFRLLDAYLNLTRKEDGAFVNLSLSPTGQNTTGSGGKIYFYNATFPTGNGKVLGMPGNYTARVVVRDSTGNWANSSARDLLIRDADAPGVSGFGAVPDVQEVGEEVTFHAIVTDQSNVTVHLEVYRGTELSYRATMNRTAGTNNYTHTTIFEAEGAYTYRIIAADTHAVPLEALPVTGPLSIRENLGPRFELREPSARADGAAFGTALPLIELLVYDSDGVDPGSINVSVAGQPVQVSRRAAGEGINGYLLSYQVLPTGKFAHGAVVHVNASALDLSNKSLPGERNFTFTVDDTPPLSSMGAFSPRWRDLEGQIWNVSLATEYELHATDNDGLPTGVSAIWYEIIGGSVSAATLYDGPFRLPEDVYTGPRVYQIQFWAEDEAGNREPSPNRLTVYVDDTPPALDPFGSLPQGRFVNATFVDDRAGVERASVWYRVDDGPYTEVPLELDLGIWSAVLPEGRKGERIAYYLQAWDRVENTQTFGTPDEPYSSYAVGNHLPSLRVTSPVEGSRVSRSVDVIWEASDADGDPLEFVVYLKSPGRPNFAEIASLDVPSARRHTLDTSRFADGQYTIRVTASDGSFVASSETTVTFLNRGSAIGPIAKPPETVKPGEGILLKAEITKAQAEVEARLHRGGAIVSVHPMNDEGREGDEAAGDGIYSVRVQIGEAGSYTVEIFTRYEEDGELLESSVSDAAVFTVLMTPGYIFANYAVVWTLLGLFGAAAIGIGVYALRRRSG